MGLQFKMPSQLVSNPDYDYNDHTTWSLPAKIPGTYTVENGQWVVKVFSGGLMQPRAIGTDALEMVTLEDMGVHGRQALFVSPTPFGVITEFKRSDNSYNVELTGTRHFVSARQVHKDELGLCVPTPSVSYAREALFVSDRPMAERNKRRGYRGWALVTDVSQATKLSLEEVLLGFWPFVKNSTFDPSTSRLSVLVGYEREAIHGRQPHVPYRLPMNRVQDLLHNSDGIYRRTWITMGFAKTIMRLRALGYQPDVSHLAYA